MKSNSLTSTSPEQILFNCNKLSDNRKNNFDIGRFNINIQHLEEEPANVNRIYIKNHDLKVELLPTKGLSIGASDFMVDNIQNTRKTV